MNASLNATLITEVSTLPVVWAHVLLVVPPILGLLWTAVQWHQVASIDVTEELDETENEGILLAGGFDRCDELQDKMQELSDIIEEGAQTFLFTEYKYMAIYVFVFSGVILGFFSYVGDVSGGVGTMAAFIVGAFTSVVSGYVGMRAATMSNVRTTFKCWTEGFGEGLAVALKGGAIMGFGLCSL